MHRFEESYIQGNEQMVGASTSFVSSMEKVASSFTLGIEKLVECVIYYQRRLKCLRPWFVVPANLISRLT